MRYTLLAFALAAMLAGLSAATAAQAQLLGARPGYANATMKQEHDRQKLQAKQRAAEKEESARQAAQQSGK